jgi:hypothetical protein
MMIRIAIATCFGNAKFLIISEDDQIQSSLS